MTSAILSEYNRCAMGKERTAAETKAEVLRLAANGLPVKLIAEKVGRTPTRIYQIRKEAGLPGSPWRGMKKAAPRIVERTCPECKKHEVGWASELDGKYCGAVCANRAQRNKGARAEVVALARKGLTNREIARQMGRADQMVGIWRRQAADEGLCPPAMNGRGKVQRVCPQCGTRFDRWYSLAVGHTSYCSKACANAGQVVTRIERACEFCGVSFYVRPGDVRGRYKGRFCSRRCLEGGVRDALDETAFAEWSVEMAYVLGVVITDGSVGRRNELTITAKDREMVAAVRDHVCPTGRIRTIDRPPPAPPVYQFRVGSGRIASDLAKFHVVPKKAQTTEWPTIPKQYLPMFLRGVLDGDGSVAKGGQVSFTTTSPAFALGLSAALGSLGLAPKMHKRVFENPKWADAFMVRLNLGDSCELGRQIYADGGPHIPRKRERFRIAV